MAVTARTITTASGTTTATIAVPSGTAAGDFLMIVCETMGGQAVTQPAGWNQFSTSPQNTTSTRLTAFWKIAGASETSVALTGPTDHIAVGMFSFSGVDLSGYVGWTDGGTNGTGTGVNFPNVSGSNINPGDYVIHLASFATDTTANQLAGYSSSELEPMYTGSFGTTSGNGGGFIWVSGYSRRGNTTDATATLTTSSEKGVLTVTFLPQALPDDYMYNAQAVTVASFLNDASDAVMNTQVLTVLDQYSDLNMMANAQMITVVVPLPARRKGFMSFIP